MSLQEITKKKNALKILGLEKSNYILINKENKDYGK